MRRIVIDAGTAEESAKLGRIRQRLVDAALKRPTCTCRHRKSPYGEAGAPLQCKFSLPHDQTLADAFKAAAITFRAAWLTAGKRSVQSWDKPGKSTAPERPPAHAVRQRDAPLRPVAMDKVVLDALPVGKSRLVLIGNLLRPRRFPSLAGRG